MRETEEILQETDLERSDLKGCKFCSLDTTEIIKANSDKADFDVFEVTCTSCGAEGPPSMEVSEAVRRWNMAHIDGFINGEGRYEK